MNCKAFFIKNIIALLALLSAGNIVMAQVPQKIYPYSVQQQSMEWYSAQAKAWRREVKKNPKDAMAWYNLYYAERLISFHDRSDKRTEEQKQKDISALQSDMEKNIAGTYELNLIKWAAGGLDFNNLPYLMKANELGTDRTEHLTHMMNITELQQKIEDKDRYAQRLYDEGEASAGMLYYNYNVLKGLDSNAVLITVGDNDTYPAWILQSIGIRKDVLILNMSLLLVDDYREKIFKKLSAKNVIIDWSKPDSAEYKFYRDVPQLIADNGKKYPFYLSLTASYIIGIAKPDMEDKLYLTGLAYRYSEKPIDNMAALKRNFEKEYALDYLDKAFFKDKSAELVKRINANYVVPMVKLYDHYKNAGDLQKQQWIKEKIMIVSDGTEDEKNITNHLSQQ